MLTRVLGSKNTRVSREEALEPVLKTNVVSCAAGKGAPPPARMGKKPDLWGRWPDEGFCLRHNQRRSLT